MASLHMPNIGASTSTAISGLLIPFTGGTSVVGIGVTAPTIHNARKKRKIIEKHLNKHGTTHDTRKRDVIKGMAISSTVRVVTLGMVHVGGEAIAAAAAASAH
ncbi:hypothetical protein B0H67DRAFT_645150 [Lasiosphaeris hirsuta]|uniref:Uncharacterized protein n=1 Tax=Lasiosphaeris hirsuta TaxID=260670 RepID=A0AA40AGF7_9PEZI|nr:hypothetical protein B0H67DRAFT_645150 [Lasiosphaeris hirsuta]